MVTDHDMRMEALRLFEENEKMKDEIKMLRKALSDIAAVTFCPKCHSKKELPGWMGDIGGNPYGPFDQ